MELIRDEEILKFSKQNLIFTRDNSGELELSRVLCDVDTVALSVDTVGGNVGYVGGNVDNVHGGVRYVEGNVGGKTNRENLKPE